MATISFNQDAVEQIAVGIGLHGEEFGIFAGAGNPWDVVTNAPQHSIYFRNDGTVWRKSGTGYTIGDWEPGIGSNTNGATEIDYVESEAESARTFTSYLEKASLAFTAEAADYWIQVNAEVAAFAKDTTVAVRCQIDDTTTVLDVDPAPDSSQFAGWGNVSMLYRATLSAGPHTIDLDYASSSSGKEVRIRKARILATKVL